MKEYNTKEFLEKHVGSESRWLKASDFENGGKIRPLPWVINGEETPFILYQEGWVNSTDPKQKNGVPLRFDIDDPIDGNYNWKMSSYQGGPLRPQSPKGAIGILCYHYNTKSLKVFCASQSGILKPLLAFTDKESQSYIPEGIHTVDIIINKVDDKTYTVSVAPKSREEIPQEALQLLRGFCFSWEGFMECGECFDEKSATRMEDIDFYNNLPVATKSETKAQTAKTTAPTAPTAPAAVSSNWHNVVTPKGVKLGDCSLAELTAMKEKLESMGKTSSPLYTAISDGYKDLSTSTEEDV